jgi:hypothetical protein
MYQNNCKTKANVFLLVKLFTLKMFKAARFITGEQLPYIFKGFKFKSISLSGLQYILVLRNKMSVLLPIICRHSDMKG